MKNKPQYATIWLGHSYEAKVEQVFSEFADPLARARWSVPLNDVLIYDQAEFRVGGKAVFRRGPKGEPQFCGETHYLDIVPNSRIVASETLTMDDHRLAVALMTLDFEIAKNGTNVTLTIQMVSFVGPDIIHGYESGNTSALKTLAQHLRNTPAA